MITVLSYANGSTLAQLSLTGVDRPMLSVFNEKLLTVSDEGKIARYVSVISTGGQVEMQRQPSFGRLDLGPLVAAHVLSAYVVVVYKTQIFIYKPDGRLLQEIEARLLNTNQAYKFEYCKSVVNPVGENNEIVIVAENTNAKSGGKTTQTQMIVLREVDAKLQIDNLLGLGRIEEANEVFNLKNASKNTENFNRNRKQFNLNAGWQMINIGQPEHMNRHFRLSDVDPRELIFLFDELLQALRPALNDHIQPNHIQQTTTLAKAYRQVQMTSQTDFQPQMKLRSAKEQIVKLFEYLNTGYLKELRKDEEKSAEFMYSEYTQNFNAIKKDKPVLLKEIVPFVQTALVRLYVEDEDRGAQKVLDFFSQFTNGTQQSHHLMLLQPELNNFLDNPQFQSRNVTRICKALYAEHRENYEEALKMWQNIKTPESYERTIQILRKHCSSTQHVQTYARRVFIEAPEIGLKLFSQQEGQSNQNDQAYLNDLDGSESLLMGNDEIIEFLQTIELELMQSNLMQRPRHGQRVDSMNERDQQPSLKLRFLEQITQDKRTEQRYFTMLGNLYI